MFRLLHIDHLVLRVVDLERMLRFYCDALGCTVERRQDEIGLIQLRAARHSSTWCRSMASSGGSAVRHLASGD